MQSANEREDLQPPQEPGALRAYALALLVHLLLAAALTWGVSWKSQDPEATFAAELWSATPQEAAPPLAAPAEPPAPVTPPAPTPPAPAAPSRDAAAAVAAAEAEAQAEIALQRERQRKRQEAEALKKAELAEKKKAEKEKADKAKAVAQAAAEKAEKEKANKAKEAAALAKAKAAKQAEAKQAAAKEQAAAEKLRQQNIARMMGMAGGTGAPDAKGTAAQSSGPSASYGGRVRARVKPNVVFTEDIAGNPVAEVEVRTSLDGTIISQRLIKSSGNKAWDDAVIKAIIRTEVLPRDVDGRVPTPLIISFRPKD